MEKQKAREVLELARENNRTVCVYGDGRSSRFSMGWVLAVSDCHVVLELVSPHGRNDGWMLRQLEAIGRIDSGGRLEETTVSLYHARGESHFKPLLPATDLNSDLKRELLLAARTHNFAVRLYNGNRDNIEGFVREIEYNTITIDVFNEHSVADGESTLELEGFEAMKVHDDELQDLKLLARWHDAPPL